MILALFLPSLAQLPLPLYPECGTPDRPDLCPSDLGEDWALLSYIPARIRDNIRPEEHAIGTGIGADKAWRRSTGRTDVVIAVLDSAIMWDDSSLLTKHYLHLPELPLPMVGDAASLTYDTNGDGVFNIDDWAQDPRVDIAAGVDVADAVLDPSDLIYTFSDGVDDDGNGFVDDISGWDFYFNDNDPYDDVRFDHGTYEAQESMRPGEDGQAIGVCPNCMAMSLRVGDSFVAEGDNFANAALYAVDNGAVVIQEALGAFSNSTLSQQAVSYAWDHDVLVVGSAADETAYHPNPPGSNPRTIYVHAVRYDADDQSDATSYMAYSNCTNHGVRLDLSASSSGCSSGATAMTAGAAGLIISAARDQGIELSAGEVFHLLVGTADDIAVGDRPDIYPTKEGWDNWSGHGRLSATNAVEAVVAGNFPPVVELTSPTWYQYLNPARQSNLEITGTITAPRSEVASWRLSYGIGPEPDDAALVTIKEGTGATAGVLATLDLSTISGMDPAAPLQDHAKGATPVDRERLVNSYTISLRLSVTDTQGRTSVARSAFYLVDDPDLVEGWPVQLPGSLEGSPKLADLNGDGKDEVIIGDADGKVHAFQADGTELPGWPVQTELLEEVDPSSADSHLDAPAFRLLDSDRRTAVLSAPAVGDLDGDGTIEVAFGTIRGALWVVGADGQPRSGFPVFAEPVTFTSPDHLIDDGFLGNVALGDFDGDGDSELAIPAMNGKLYIWRHDGTMLDGWPQALVFPGREDYRARVTAGPAIGDLNGDGKDDLVLPSNEVLDSEHAALYAFSGDGSLLPGWPIRVWGVEVDVLPMVGQGFHSSVALADMDGGGTPEIFGGALAGDFSIWNADGSQRNTLPYVGSRYGASSNLNDPSFLPLITIPAFADLDGDGVPDPIAGGTGANYLKGNLQDGVRVNFDHAVGAWNGATGDLLPGFPRQIEDLMFLSSPAAADIDGDRRVEVIAGSGGFLLHAWNVDGVEPAGWPKFMGQWIMPSPAIGDMDGDGKLEVVAGVRSGGLFAWHTSTPRDGRVDWQSNGHDNANTRNFATNLPGFNAPVQDEEQPKAELPCGCSTGAEPGVLALLGLAFLRRRRASR